LAVIVAASEVVPSVVPVLLSEVAWKTSVPTGALKFTEQVTLAPAVVQPVADGPTLTVVETAVDGVAPFTDSSESVIDCVAGETNLGARFVELICTGVYC
jgi:hypothetical protein